MWVDFRCERWKMDFKYVQLVPYNPAETFNKIYEYKQQHIPDRLSFKICTFTDDIPYVLFFRDSEGVFHTCRMGFLIYPAASFQKDERISEVAGYSCRCWEDYVRKIINMLKL